MIDPNVLVTSASTGMLPAEEAFDLRKALTADYGTDVANLTGGGALRLQSLDTTLQSTIQDNQHFRLFNKLAKPQVTATVDEWTEVSSVGGFLGGSTTSESGAISDATGNYHRRVGMVKYLMTRRQVSFVTSLQNAIAEAEAVEFQNGALQLLTDAEFLCFEGDSTVIPTEFDGIAAQISQGVASGDIDDDHLLDARAQSLASIALVNRAAATIAAYGNFGMPTDLFMSQQVQADFDTALDPAFRVPLTDVPSGGVALGAPVRGIRTSWGDIATNPDVFIRDEVLQMPFELRYPAVATAQAGLMPQGVTATAAVAASSQFGSTQAGSYYYYVTGVNASGQSTGVTSAPVAVTAGENVTLTITASSSGQETGYVIYRSRLNGGNAVSGLPLVMSDFREMIRIPKAGATTPHTDANRDIPGTSKAFVLNLASSASAMTWRQLLPMLKFPLYPTQSAVIPWAQMLFGYLRISKRRQHVMIKNILPTNAVWRPFN